MTPPLDLKKKKKHGPHEDGAEGQKQGISNVVVAHQGKEGWSDISLRLTDDDEFLGLGRDGEAIHNKDFAAREQDDNVPPQPRTSFVIEVPASSIPQVRQRSSGNDVRLDEAPSFNDSITTPSLHSDNWPDLLDTKKSAQKVAASIVPPSHLSLSSTQQDHRLPQGVTVTGHNRASNLIGERMRYDSTFHNEDCVDTYGATILAHFRKEGLEREHKIHDKPRLLSGKMKFLLVLMELVIIALFVIFLYWLLVMEKARIDLQDFLKGVASEDYRNRKQHKEEIASRISTHMTVYISVFIVIIPNILVITVVFDFVSANRLAAVTFTLKLISFFLFFGAWFNITSANSADLEARDFKTHYYFSKFSLAVFIVYIVVTGVRVAGHLFRRIFQLRIVGKLFKVIVSDWFVGAIDHLTNATGFIAVGTGVIAYIFKATKEERLLILDDEHEEDLELRENWLIRSICLLLVFLYVLILFTNFHRHYINNHQHFLRVEDFKNDFLEFQNLYDEEDVMKMGQDMPKVTSAQRML